MLLIVKEKHMEFTLNKNYTRQNIKNLFKTCQTGPTTFLVNPHVHMRYLKITGTKYKAEGFGLRDVAALGFTFDGKD